MKNIPKAAALCLLIPTLLFASDPPAALPADFDEFVLEGMAMWKVPGLALAVVKDGETILVKGYGVREFGKPDLVDAETLFAIGSATKAFTSAAVGQVVDKGLIQWDTRVTEIDPSIEFSSPWITGEMRVSDLLANHSGLSLISEALWYGTGLDREEIIKRLRYVPFDESFRYQFQYRNVMFLLAGQLLPRVTEHTWDERITEHLFKPLKMSRSFATDAGLEGQENVAQPHVINYASEPLTVPYRRMDNVAPAGSIISCVDDMANWTKMQLDSGKFGDLEILKPGTLAFTHRSQTPMDTVGPAGQPLSPAQLRAYCLGWVTESYRGNVLVWHNGGIDGMSAWVGLAPDLKLGVAVLSNLENCDLRTAIFYRLVDHFSGNPLTDLREELVESFWAGIHTRDAAEEKWQSLAEKPADPGLALPTYAGTYTNPAMGDVRTALEDDQLVYYRTPEQTLDLRPSGPNTFLARYRNPSEDLRSGKVTLTFDVRDGAPAAFHEDGIVTYVLKKSD